MTEETAQLSERECEILRLAATGATNQQIASRLDISVNTVKVHMRNIFGKIGASSRTEATLYAMRLGLVDIGGRPAPLTAPEPAPGTAEVALTPEAPVVAVAEPPEAEPEPAPVSPVSPEPLQGVAELSAPLATPAELELSAPVPAAGLRLPVWALALAALLILALAGAVAYQAFTDSAPAGTSATAVPQPERWRQHAPLPQPRADFAAASYDGRVYLIGGAGPAGPLDAVERLDPSSDSWVALSNKPTPVSHVQAAIVGGRICVPGGEAEGGAPVAAFECYDPRGERWEALAPLPEPRSRYALASVEGVIYLFGGWDGSAYRAEVFAYDPDSDRWEPRAPMPTARRGAGAAVVESRVYIIGGEGDGGALRVNERYDPANDAGGQPWASAVPLPQPIAAPAVAGIANVILVFDPERQAAAQFLPSTESWGTLVLPEGIGVSSRAAALTTSVLVFGQAPPDQPAPVSEYQAVFTSNIPVVP